MKIVYTLVFVLAVVFSIVGVRAEEHFSLFEESSSEDLLLPSDISISFFGPEPNIRLKNQNIGTLRVTVDDAPTDPLTVNLELVRLDGATGSLQGTTVGTISPGSTSINFSDLSISASGQYNIRVVAPNTTLSAASLSEPFTIQSRRNAFITASAADNPDETINFIDFPRRTPVGQLNEGNTATIYEFVLNDGGVDGLQTRLTELNFRVQNTAAISQLVLFRNDGSGFVRVLTRDLEGSDNPFVQFQNANLGTTADGATTSFRIAATFVNQVEDQTLVQAELLSFRVNQEDDFTQLREADPIVNPLSGVKTLNVVATAFDILIPSGNNQAINRTFQVELRAVDSRGNLDRTYDATANISLASIANGTISPSQIIVNQGVGQANLRLEIDEGLIHGTPLSQTGDLQFTQGSVTTSRAVNFSRVGVIASSATLNLCPNTSDFESLGDVQILETNSQSTGLFQVGVNKSFVLELEDGFEFDTNRGSASVSSQGGGISDISNVELIVQRKRVTLLLTVSATNAQDVITLTDLFVRPEAGFTTGTNLVLRRSGGTANFPGLSIARGINYFGGSVSIADVSTPTGITIPDEICDGDNFIVSFDSNAGIAVSYRLVRRRNATETVLATIAASSSATEFAAISSSMVASNDRLFVRTQEQGSSCSLDSEEVVITKIQLPNPRVFTEIGNTSSEVSPRNICGGTALEGEFSGAQSYNVSLQRQTSPGEYEVATETNINVVGNTFSINTNPLEAGVVYRIFLEGGSSSNFASSSCFEETSFFFQVNPNLDAADLEVSISPTFFNVITDGSGNPSSDFPTGVVIDASLADGVSVAGSFQFSGEGVIGNRFFPEEVAFTDEDEIKTIPIIATFVTDEGCVSEAVTIEVRAFNGELIFEGLQEGVCLDEDYEIEFEINNVQLVPPAIPFASNQITVSYFSNNTERVLFSITVSRNLVNLLSVNYSSASPLPGTFVVLENFTEGESGNIRVSFSKSDFPLEVDQRGLGQFGIRVIGANESEATQDFFFDKFIDVEPIHPQALCFDCDLPFLSTIGNEFSVANDLKGSTLSVRASRQSDFSGQVLNLPLTSPQANANVLRNLFSAANQIDLENGTPIYLEFSVDNFCSSSATSEITMFRKPPTPDQEITIDGLSLGSFNGFFTIQNQAPAIFRPSQAENTDLVFYHFFNAEGIRVTGAPVSDFEASNALTGAEGNTLFFVERIINGFSSDRHPFVWSVQRPPALNFSGLTEAVCDDDPVGITIEISGPNEERWSNTLALKVLQSTSGDPAEGSLRLIGGNNNTSELLINDLQIAYNAEGIGESFAQPTTLELEYIPTEGESISGEEYRITADFQAVNNLNQNNLSAEASAQAFSELRPQLILIDAEIIEVCSQEEVQLSTSLANGNLNDARFNWEIITGDGEFLWLDENGDEEKGTIAPVIDPIYLPSASELAEGSSDIQFEISVFDINGLCDSDVKIQNLQIDQRALISASVDELICADQNPILLRANLNGAASAASWEVVLDDELSSEEEQAILDRLSSSEVNNGEVTATFELTREEQLTGITYQFKVTTDDPNDNVCGAESDLVTIQVDPIADFEFVQEGLLIDGDDNPFMRLCSPEEISFLVSREGVAESFVWTDNGGGGQFRFATSDNDQISPSYEPSATLLSDGGIIEITATAVDISGQCGEVSKSFTLIIDQEPTITLEQDEYIFCADDQIEFRGSFGGTATNAAWEISPNNPSDLEPQGALTNEVVGNEVIGRYIPTAEEITSGINIIFRLLSSDPSADSDQTCGAVFADAVVRMNQIARVVAGDDIRVCASEANEVQLFGSVTGAVTSGLWTSNGNGTFNPSADALNARYAPSADEILNGAEIILTLTSAEPVGPCSSQIDDLTLVIDQAPILNLIDDFDICAGSEIPLIATLEASLEGQSGNWSIIEGGGQIENTQAVSTIYIPTEEEMSNGADLRFEFVSDQPIDNVCSPQSAILNVRLEPIPKAPSVNEPPIFCQGANIPNISAEGVNIRWYADSELTQQLPATLSGNLISQIDSDIVGVYTFFATQTVAGCESVGELVQIIVNPIPVPDFEVENICFGDETRFVNMTSFEGDGDLFYTWDFGDRTVLPGEENPTHRYVNPANNLTVTLTATSTNEDGSSCSVSTSKNITIADAPRLTLFEESTCLEQGVSFITDFQQTIGSEPDLWIWDFGDGTIIQGPGLTQANQDNPVVGMESTSGTFKRPIHRYQTAGIKTITVTAISGEGVAEDGAIAELGCGITLTRQVGVYPQKRQFPYFEDFENGSGGWISSLDNENTRNSSWTLAPFDLHGEQGQVWRTAASGNTAYSSNERSYVESPCFDFSELERPVMSLKVFVSTDQGLDGAAVMVKSGEMTDYQLLGNLQSGINWYNQANIAGNPGQQAIGQLGWTGLRDEDGFQTARIALDQFAGDEQVKIRIVFGSNADTPSPEAQGFAFDDIFIGERTRKVLLEHFTNTSSNNFLSDMQTVDDFIEESAEELLLVRYHIAEPEPDEIHLVNRADPGARALVYGVEAAPRVSLDGSFDGLAFGNETRAQFELRKLIEASVDLSLQIELQEDQSVIFTCGITAETNLPQADYRLYLAIVEDNVSEQESDASSAVVSHVLRQLLPDAAGTALSTEWFSGSTASHQVIWRESLLSRSENAKVVMWVQNNNTKEILQSEVFGLDLTPQLITSVGDTQFDQVKLYPNPTSKQATIALGGLTFAGSEYLIIDSNGRTLMKERLPAGIDKWHIDISHLKQGMYFVNLLSENGESKVMKLSVIK
ncbi:MAG: T9SS type A sorting domain-containing protein [Cyclobacteriaceae bacterium]|nr:T9SS type A sorting domain-containing protein [Cyclobacteriaceae bacterium]MCH8515531.1 T9SS type A sorting domain-containing protein [Cyclobacteriaceae bacterium]